MRGLAEELFELPEEMMLRQTCHRGDLGYGQRVAVGGIDVVPCMVESPVEFRTCRLTDGAQALEFWTNPAMDHEEAFKEFAEPLVEP